MTADQLQLLGFRGVSAQSLKPRYANALLKRWQGESLSIDKIKNLMTVLRWWAQKVHPQLGKIMMYLCSIVMRRSPSKRPLVFPFASSA